MKLNLILALHCKTMEKSTLSGYLVLEFLKVLNSTKLELRNSILGTKTGYSFKIGVSG